MPMPTPRNISRIPAKKLLWWGLGTAFLVILPRLTTTILAQPHLSTVEDVEQHEYAIILAAEVKPDGTPALVLQHRVQRGVDLYRAGKAAKVVMSGNNWETAAMQQYARSLGVPDEDIVLDNGGIRTYATCNNAVHYLRAGKAIMVTQPYHMPRTLFLCQQLGLEAVGVPAFHGRYWRGSWVVWQVRETLATVLAFKELTVSPPDTSEYLNLAREGANHD